MYNNTKLLIAVFAILFSVGSAQATTVLMDDQYLSTSYAYTGAGGTGWTDFSNSLDTATGNNVTVGNFNDLGYMMGFDSIFVNLRCTTCTLSTTEYNNISSYINNGGRAVIIGENTNWTAWDQQVIGMVGGSFSNTYYSGVTNSISSNALVDGVNQVYLPAGGIVATGGEALFANNFATLWGDNVLTILDVNIMSDSFINNNDNRQFMDNVSNWIANTSTSVPETGSLALMVAGMLLLVGGRKVKAS